MENRGGVQPGAESFVVEKGLLDGRGFIPVVNQGGVHLVPSAILLQAVLSRRVRRGSARSLIIIEEIMRIFVGLDIDEQIRGRIAEFIAEVRGLAPDVRWVTPVSLHVTLKFIGEKSEAAVAAIEKAEGDISAEAFDIPFL